MTERKTTLRWINGLLFLLVIAVNLLAELLPIGGVTTGEVSKRYENLFTPAPFTFAIWGVIYLLTAGFVLYQAGAFKKERANADEIVERVGLWFAFSCALNCAWMLLWHYDQIALSTLMLLGLLITLAVLVQKVRAGRASLAERLLVRAPFSLYFGWVTVALIANICTFLVKLQWNGFGIPPQTWMYIVLPLGALIGCAAILRGRDLVYGLAVLWAYFGILFRHASSGGYHAKYPAVIVTAGLCMVLVLLAIVRAARSEKQTAQGV